MCNIDSTYTGKFVIVYHNSILHSCGAPTFLEVGERTEEQAKCCNYLLQGPVECLGVLRRPFFCDQVVTQKLGLAVPVEPPSLPPLFSAESS